MIRRLQVVERVGAPTLFTVDRVPYDNALDARVALSAPRVARHERWKVRERDSLERIRQLYSLLIQRATARHLEIRPAVVAAIMQRESQGGLSPLLDAMGPEGRGDHGHGHGLMQIDDRWHRAFIASGQWRDPYASIAYAVSLLADNFSVLRAAKLSSLAYPDERERAAIAAYNCGAGAVLKAARACPTKDIDAYTTHGNYSAEVLRLAEIYVDLVKLASPPTVQDAVATSPAPDAVGSLPQPD